MKKGKLLLFAILASLALTSCGETSNPVTTSIAPTTSETTSVAAEHTVTFMADGQVVATVNFHEGDTTVSEPTVPEKKGYSGAWESYTLGTSDITVNAVYTAIEYTATYKVNSKVYREIKYTIENYATAEIPDVPASTSEHYEGVWNPTPDYSILKDQTYKAVYSVDLAVKSGAFDFVDGRYEASDNNALGLEKTSKLAKGTLSTNMLKATAEEDSGIIFGLSYSETELDTFWEVEGVSYYFFFVSMNNTAYLAKSVNGVWNQLGADVAITEYNEEMDYPLSVSFDNGHIQCYVGDECLINYKDNDPLTGSIYGYRAGKVGTRYEIITTSDEVRKDESQVIDGYSITSGKVEAIEGGYKTAQANTLVVKENAHYEEGKIYSFNMTQNNKQDAGIVLGLNANGARSFWEGNVSYFVLLINFDGIILLGEINQGVWSTRYENNNIKDFKATTTYKLGYSISGNTITGYVNGIIVCKYTASTIFGTEMGIRFAQAGATFTLIEEETKNAEKFDLYQRSGSYTYNDDGTVTTTCDGSLAWVDNYQFEEGKGGVFSVDVKSEIAANVGICFGVENKETVRWTNGEYYVMWADHASNFALASDIDPWNCLASCPTADQEWWHGINEFNNYKIVFNGSNKIKCYVNDILVHDVIVPEANIHTGLYFGIISQSTKLVTYKNFAYSNNI